MTTKIRASVKQYMRECIHSGDCSDSAGEISRTELAEWACDEFDGWNENEDIPEFFFEWAHEVACEMEPQL